VRGAAGDLVAWRQGAYDKSAALQNEALALERGRGEEADCEVLAAIMNNLGELARCRGDLEKAALLYAEALVTAHQIGFAVVETLSLAGLGGVAAGCGQARRAARLLSAATAQREALVVPLDPANQLEHDRMVATARAALDEAAWSEAWSQGRTDTLETAVRFALEGVT
jgi:ATP/maltotriose-dependent transcriptional regulator MalT